MHSCGVTYTCPACRQIPGVGMPTDAELIRALKESWYEQSKLITSLLEARAIDLASVAMLIDRSPDPVALNELRGIILDAVEELKGLRKGLEVKNDSKT